MLLESILRHTKFKSVLIINLTGYVEDLAVAAAFLPICGTFLFSTTLFFLSGRDVEPCAITGDLAKVANMRTKPGQHPADSGLNMPFDQLYYLSVHTLDNKEGVQYAKTRVTRELLDMWVDKRFTFAGLSFDDSQPVLSDADAWLFHDVFPCSTNL